MGRPRSDDAKLTVPIALPFSYDEGTASLPVYAGGVPAVRRLAEDTHPIVFLRWPEQHPRAIAVGLKPAFRIVA